MVPPETPITLALPAAMVQDVLNLIAAQPISSGFAPHHAEITRQAVEQTTDTPAAAS